MEVEPYTNSFLTDQQSSLSSGPSTSKGSIAVRYVHCQNLFLREVHEKMITNLTPSTTLEELIRLIARAEGVSLDMTLELYFGEGYPLDPNNITLKGKFDYHW